MDFLNGKKTAIGSALVQVGLWGPKFLCDAAVAGEELVCNPTWLALVFTLAAAIGSALVGVGLVHKQRKGELAAPK